MKSNFNGLHPCTIKNIDFFHLENDYTSTLISAGIGDRYLLVDRKIDRAFHRNILRARWLYVKQHY